MTVADVAGDAPRIDASATVQAFADRLVADRRTELPVERDGEVVGVVTMAALERVRPVERDAYLVEEVMQTDLPRIESDADAFEALAELNDGDSEAAFVTRDGDVVGVVTGADYANVIRTREALGDAVPV